MSCNVFGRHFRVTTFGEDQGPALGVVIDGVPPRLKLSLEKIQAEVNRCQSGTVNTHVGGAPIQDRVTMLSGLMEGQTTGAPLCLVVVNPEVKQNDGSALKDVFRPGHDDLTWFMKYGIRDWRGGGRGSARENLARVAAGAVAREVLAGQGVVLLGFTTELAGIRALAFDPQYVAENPLGCPDPDRYETMMEAIEIAEREGDSVGGVVEVRVSGLPAGWGDPVFGKLDARLAGALMGISGVKGVEVGDGFKLARMRGSEANDAISPDGFESNHAGGVLGGISNGEDLVLRLAIKPTPGIRKPQMSVDSWGNPTVVSIGGKHEPCVVPRVLPVAEAMVALVLVDACLSQRTIIPPEKRESRAR